MLHVELNIFDHSEFCEGVWPYVHVLRWRGANDGNIAVDIASFEDARDRLSNAIGRNLVLGK